MSELANAASTPPVLVERTGDVVLWTLNNPAARNPISEAETVDALEAAIAAVNADPSVRVAILTGAGTAFSSGGNVKHMRDRIGMFGGSPPNCGRATGTVSSASRRRCTTARFRPSPR